MRPMPDQPAANESTRIRNQGSGFFNVPNVLTCLRVLLIPFFVAMMVQRKAFEALLIILVAGATDVLDGLAARATRQKTRAGAFLDPAADKLMMSPQVYSTLLLWLLSELFERLPEAGDLPKPKLVFFFDEAHLLFGDSPPALLTKIEQVVRLIRSKGVGVCFVTQNPIDIPDTVLGQLGNKVQHALRAFTPREQKAVKAMAETFRPNPEVDVETAVTDLSVGEALLSLLEADGSPSMVQRAFVVPPHARIGAITPEQRRQVIAASLVAGHYEQLVDRDSAAEVLLARAKAALVAADEAAAAAAAAAETDARTRPAPRPEPGAEARTTAPRAGRTRESAVEAMGKSMVRAVGSQLGRQIARGLLGTFLKTR